MEDKLNKISEVLNQLIGLHRQLLEVIRMERSHLAEADVQSIKKITDQKHVKIEEIHQVEAHRMKLLAEFAVESNRPLKELSLTALILSIQGDDPRLAQQLSSAKNTLVILSQRIQEQNKENLGLIERSLENIEAMKNNLIGSQKPHSETYSQQGQRVSSPSTHRILSQEV